MISRRRFIQSLAITAAATTLPLRAASPRLEVKYLLGSALFGGMKLDAVLPEVRAAGCAGLDIWCKPHGTQREQVEAMGLEAFADLLKKHSVQLVCSTRYPQGPFALQDEMKVLKQLGAGLLVTGSSGPKNVAGPEARAGVGKFLEQMKPHADAAAEHGITIAVENHAGSLLHTPDSIRYWAELNKHPALGMALALHHLHEHVEEMPKLIRDLGAANLPFIYFQEYSEGEFKKAPKEIEMQQLPGFGTLDYRPILSALRDVGFHGWAEIFMHPMPRGVPILPTAGDITAAVNKSRAYVQKLLDEVNG